MTRVILFAGNPSTDWYPQLGVPKYLAPVPSPEGVEEPVINRTLQQLRIRGIEDIHVITPSPIDATNIAVHPPIAGPIGCDVILHASRWWNDHGQTLILMGDWFFTAAVMDLILAHTNDHREWTHLARLDASRHSGQRWIEDCGVSFYPYDMNRYLAAVCHVKQLHSAGRLPRGGAWEIWSHLNGTPDDRIWSSLYHPGVKTLQHCLHLPDDGSGDFDVPECYERWYTTAHQRHIDLTY